MARQAICGGANPSNVVGGESILRSCPGPLNQQLIQRCMCAGYRSAVMSTRLAAEVISSRSAGESSTSAAAVFSCRRWSLVVPGMGTIVGCWARIQANATCAGVALLRAAIAATKRFGVGHGSVRGAARHCGSGGAHRRRTRRHPKIR